LNDRSCPGEAITTHCRVIVLATVHHTPSGHGLRIRSGHSQ